MRLFDLVGHSYVFALMVTKNPRKYPKSELVFAALVDFEGRIRKEKFHQCSLFRLK